MEEHGSINLDKLIHQKARLGIMSILLVMEEAEFNYLKERLSLSDGNLGSHLGILEKQKYIKIKKKFVRKKPRTTCQLTEKGRQAFLDYMNVLEEIIHGLPKG